MAGPRKKIDIKRADKPKLLKKEYFELEDEVYDVIERAKEILEIGSNEEITVTTEKGLEIKEEDYDKKLCEIDWKTFILKPLPRRQAKFTMQQAVKDIKVLKINETENEEISILQKKFLYNGLKGFNLKIVPESLSFESFSWSHEQQFLSDEEMRKEDQSSEEISKNKLFKGDLGASFAGFGGTMGGEYNSASNTKEQHSQRKSRKTSTAVFRRAVWCRRNIFNVRITLDNDTKEYIRHNVEKPSFASDFRKKYVYSGF